VEKVKSNNNEREILQEEDMMWSWGGGDNRDWFAESKTLRSNFSVTLNANGKGEASSMKISCKVTRSGRIIAGSIDDCVTGSLQLEIVEVVGRCVVVCLRVVVSRGWGAVVASGWSMWMTITAETDEVTSSTESDGIDVEVVDGAGVVVARVVGARVVGVRVVGARDGGARVAGTLVVSKGFVNGDITATGRGTTP